MTASAFFQPRPGAKSGYRPDAPEAKTDAKASSAPAKPKVLKHDWTPKISTWEHAPAQGGSLQSRVWSRRSNSKPKRTEAKEQALGYRLGFEATAGLEPLELLQRQLHEVSEEEQQLRARLRDLEHRLAQKCGADGEDYGHRKTRLKSCADAAASTVRSLQQRRVAILQGDDPKLREEQQRRSELRRFKTSSGYGSEEIAAQIQSLEKQMYEETLELQQEKLLLGEIHSLQRQQREVQEHRLLEASLRTDEEIIRSSLQEISEQMAAKLQECREAGTELKALEEERDKALAQSPETGERAEVHHNLKECLQRKAQIKERLEWKERIIAKEKAWEEEEQRKQEEKQQAAEEEARRRKEREERLERMKEERKQEERRHVQQVRPAAGLESLPKVEEVPGFAELRLLEQTLQYCKKLLPKNMDSVQEKKPIQYNNPDGSLIIVPKEERSEEYLFAPPKPRRHEGKVNKRPPTSKLKKTRTEGEQVLMHSPLSLQLFEELRMTPPVCTSDVAPTVEELEQRIATLQRAAAEWELKRQELWAPKDKARPRARRHESSGEAEPTAEEAEEPSG